MRHRVTYAGAQQPSASSAKLETQHWAVLADDGVRLGEEPSVRRLRFAALGLIGAFFQLLTVWLCMTSAQTAQVQSHASVNEINIVDYGIYEPMRGPLPKGVPAYSVDDVQLVAVTNSITAKIGVKFGFRYMIIGEPFGAPVAVKAVILFPPAGLVSPDKGLIHSVSNLTTERIGAKKAIACRIDEPWQSVPGTWTIQLWVGSQKFAEQSFNVIPQQLATN